MKLGLSLVKTLSLEMGFKRKNECTFFLEIKAQNFLDCKMFRFYCK